MKLCISLTFLRLNFNAFQLTLFVIISRDSSLKNVFQIVLKKSETKHWNETLKRKAINLRFNEQLSLVCFDIKCSKHLQKLSYVQRLKGTPLDLFYVSLTIFQQSKDDKKLVSLLCALGFFYCKSLRFILISVPPSDIHACMLWYWLLLSTNRTRVCAFFASDGGANCMPIDLDTISSGVHVWRICWYLLNIQALIALIFVWSPPEIYLFCMHFNYTKYDLQTTGS